MKERGQAQFQGVCGDAGTMPYPTLSSGCGVGDGDESRCGCGASDVAGCCAEEGQSMSEQDRREVPPPMPLLPRGKARRSLGA